MNILPFTSPTDPDWLRLRRSLWPDVPDETHWVEMRRIVADPQRYAAFVASQGPGEAFGAEGAVGDAEGVGEAKAFGCAEVSLRSDPVNGAGSAPVAFLEGLFVESAVQRQGVARRLVQAAIDWGRARGCRALVSDAAVDDERSHALHAALGFRETERLVFYELAIGPEPEP